MLRKLSREVTRRKDLCELAVSSVRNQGSIIGASLGDTLNPMLREGETPPDFEMPLELCGRKIASSCERMEAADEAHRLRLVEFIALRSDRSVHLDNLKDRYLDLRSLCSGLLGDDSLAPLALDFHVAQNAKDMLVQAEIVTRRLRRPGLELVPARWNVTPPDPESLAQAFDDDVAALRRTLTAIFDLRRELDVLVVAKRKAIEAFDREFIPLAQLLEASFRVAGHDELADRIRPTVRRLTRNDGGPGEAEPPPDSPEAAPDGSSETAPDGPSGPPAEKPTAPSAGSDADPAPAASAP